MLLGSGERGGKKRNHLMFNLTLFRITKRKRYNSTTTTTQEDTPIYIYGKQREDRESEIDRIHHKESNHKISV
jgi:hypothetical protein